MKSKLGKIRARNTGLSSNASNTNSSHSRDRQKVGGGSGLGNSGQGGLILPPMVNAQKYQSYQDAQQKIEKHHLPPTGGAQTSTAASGLSGHRPSQPHLQQLNGQSTYFPVAQSVSAPNVSGGLPSASSVSTSQIKSNPITATHLSDRKQSLDNV